MTHKLIYGSFLSRVRCPPSTIFHLGHIVAEFTRSPVPVEHHHRHHAVVLTELIPDTLLDQSPGIVIALNVCRTRRCRTFGTRSVEMRRPSTISTTWSKCFRFRSTRVRGQHSPLSLLCITMILCVRRIFF